MENKILLSNLGKMIKSFRVTEGLSQEEFAKKLKISTNSLSRYENGTRAMDIVTFYQITIALKVTPNQLFSLEGQGESLLSMFEDDIKASQEFRKELQESIKHLKEQKKLVEDLMEVAVKDLKDIPELAQLYKQLKNRQKS